MPTFFFAKDNLGNYIYDNFPSELTYLVTNYKHKENPFLIKLEGNVLPARLGHQAFEYGEIYVLTTDTKFVNRKKFFKELVLKSKMWLNPFVSFKNSFEKKNNDIIDEFMHNVTSLNTYAIQDLFSLIPERVLTENINSQKTNILDIIKTKPNITVDTILNIIKYVVTAKIEFAVFQNTLKPNITVQKAEYKTF